MEKKKELTNKEKSYIHNRSSHRQHNTACRATHHSPDSVCPDSTFLQPKYTLSCLGPDLSPASSIFIGFIFSLYFFLLFYFLFQSFFLAHPIPQIAFSSFPISSYPTSEVELPLFSSLFLSFLSVFSARFFCACELRPETKPLFGPHQQARRHPQSPGPCPNDSQANPFSRAQQSGRPSLPNICVFHNCQNGAHPGLSFPMLFCHRC